MKTLEAASGYEFDKVFLPAMEKGHQEAIQMLLDEQPGLGKNGTARFVEVLIPILRQHEELSVHLEKKENEDDQTV